ncbi:MAG: oligosaccharide flippase family protein [Leclercia sp.]
MSNGSLKNIAWNSFGYIVPIVVTIVIIPVTIKILGVEKFGTLSFLWMLVGYSSFLDMGVGRALTHYIATTVSTENEKFIVGIVKRTIARLFLCLFIILAVGMVGSVIYLYVKNGHLDGLMYAAVVMVISCTVITASALRGVLEGFQAFKSIGISRVIVGILISVSPVIVFSLSDSLLWVFFIFFVIRLFESSIYLWLANDNCKKLTQQFTPAMPNLKNIFHFGIWSNITNLVGAPMAAAYLDKFLIVTLLGATSLTYYTVPFDIMARFLILPAILTGVLFPLLSKGGGLNNRVFITNLGLNTLALTILPIFVVAISLSKLGLTLWLGNIGEKMFVILSILAIGKFCESLNFVLLTSIQSFGRPDLTAKRHIVELPFYTAIMFLGIKYYGLMGVAITWCGWAIIDLAFLHYIYNNINGATSIMQGISKIKICYYAIIFGCCLYVSILLQDRYSLQMVSAGVIILFHLIMSWCFLLDDLSKQEIIKKYYVLRNK